MTVAVSLVRTLVDAVERAGVPPERFLAAAGLEPAALADADGRVERARYDRLGELALDMTGRPGLGLAMGENAPLAAFHVLGPLVVHAPTLRAALADVTRYYRLVSGSRAPRLVEEGDHARIAYDFVRSSPDVDRMRAEFALAFTTTFGDRILGKAGWLLEAWFEHAAPAHAADYRRAFGGAERFGMPETALVFPRALLDRPQRHQDARMLELVRARADEALRRLELRTTCAERVHELVLRGGGCDGLTVAEAARALDLTPRTLQRRLAHEGTTFQDVVGHARAVVARRILAESRTTTQQAAFRLGFSDASAFHRAFRRWTGMTPARYRASLR